MHNLKMKNVHNEINTGTGGAKCPLRAISS